MKTKLTSVILTLCVIATAFSTLKIETKATSEDSIFINKESDVKFINSNTFNLNLETYQLVDAKTKPLDVIFVVDESKQMNESYKNNYNYSFGFKNKDVRIGFPFLFMKIDGNYMHFHVTDDGASDPDRREYTYESFEDKDGVKHTFKSVGENSLPPVQLYELLHDPKSRIDRSKEIIESYAYQLNKFNSENRIAIIGCSTEDNTSYYTDVKEQKYKDVLTQDQYTGAFFKPEESKVKLALEKLNIEQYAEYSVGFKFADKIKSFDKVLNPGERKTVVVLLSNLNKTESECNADGNTLTEHWNKNILSAKQYLKDKGVEIYNYCLLPDYYNCEQDFTHQYLRYLSSDYPNAVSRDNHGERENNKYFKHSTDDEGFVKAIENNEELYAVPKANTKESVQFKNCFKDGYSIDESSIKIYRKIYNKDPDIAPKIIDITSSTDYTYNKKDNVLEIDNINYKKYCASLIKGVEVKVGESIVVNYNIISNHEYIGSYSEDVLKDDSGIFDGDNKIKKFSNIKVWYVDLNYDFDAQNQCVINGNNFDIKNLFEQNIKYEVNGIRNKNVDIVYTIKQDEKELATYTIQKGQADGIWHFVNGESIQNIQQKQKITINCTVKPEVNFSQPLDITKEVYIYLFVPEIEIKEQVKPTKNVNLNSLITLSWFYEDDKTIKLPQEEFCKINYVFLNRANNNVIDNSLNYNSDFGLKVKLIGLYCDGKYFNLNDKNHIINLKKYVEEIKDNTNNKDTKNKADETKNINQSKENIKTDNELNSTKNIKEETTKAKQEEKSTETDKTKSTNNNNKENKSQTNKSKKAKIIAGVAGVMLVGSGGLVYFKKIK